MAVINTEEGFVIFVGSDGVKKFCVLSDRIEECVAYIRKHKITRIALDRDWGYRRRDLDFLTGIEDLIDGIVLSDETIDQSAVNRLHKLTYIGICDNGRDTIDLSNFPDLESASIKYGRRLVGLESSHKLKHLTINGYRPKCGDMTELPHLPMLNELWIFKGNLSSLEGIGRQPLEILWLWALPKLVSVSAVKSLTESLRKLQMESCRKVTDFDSLRSMRALEKLTISESGSIPSIDFIREIPRLIYFNFWGTNVLDGNLAPLEGLKYASFDDKRHYSRKHQDFRWDKITWDD